MRKRTEKEVVFAEVPRPLKAGLRVAAVASGRELMRDVDMTEIVIEALVEKLDRLSKKHPEIKQAMAA